MIPSALTRGHSFKELGRYLHKDRAGNDRALWSSMENVGTDNPVTAAKIMAFTAKHADELKAAAGVKNTGRKSEKGPVYHAVMSWAEGQTPTPEHQLAAARELLAHLGLDKAQAMLVAQNDNGLEHVHIMVNLVDPETGKQFSVHQDAKKMQAWGLAYERANGGVIVKKRERNAEARAEGKPTEKSEPKHPKWIKDRAEAAASTAWQQRKAERDAAFARQSAERADLRATHSAEWKAAKAEAARFKAAYSSALSAAYQRHKAADKAANKPAWGALFKRQDAERRAAVNVAANTQQAAERARVATRDSLRALNRADRRKASKLGRLAQRVGLTMTPEEARARHMQAVAHMNHTAQQLAAAELAKAGLAAKHEAERKALGKQLSDATYAKAKLDVSNMPRADFSPMIERQNAQQAEQIERQNAERAALGMKPYEPRPYGDKKAMSPLEKMEPQAQRARADFGRAAPKPLPTQPEAERPKVQGAFRAPAPNGHKVGVTFGAPTKAAQDQAREQAKAQREQTAAKPAAPTFTPSNDRTGFSLADIRAQRLQNGDKEASQKAAEESAKNTQRGITRDNDRSDDFTM